MTFYKIIKYDIKNGIFKEYRKYILAFIIFCVFCIDYNIKSNCGSFVDYIFYNMSAIVKYEYSPDTPFRFPVLWTLIMLLILYFILSYPYNDLHGYGKNILLNFQSRRKWWLSKCIWTTISILIFFFIMYATAFIFTIICKRDISFNVSNEGFEVIVLSQDLTAIGSDLLELKSTPTLTAFIMILPVITCITIGMIQLFLSLWIRPLYSYVVSITLLIASTYYTSKFLIGNYGMVLRSNAIVSNGMSMKMGIIILLVICILVYIIGNITFKHYDIIGKER